MKKPISESKSDPQPQRTITEEPASDPVRAVGASVYAGPAVRKLARELGVDLTQVNGSGANGRIIKDDVKSFVKKSFTQPDSLENGSRNSGD